MKNTTNYQVIRGFTVPKEEVDVKVPWSYLADQFADNDKIIASMKELVVSGDFTLGAPLTEFEERFAKVMGVKHAIGVNSGTDAIKLALIALGIGHGDEVITTANTFIATVGAIAEIGAKPVLVDCTDNFCIDESKIEAVITSKTKAIVPVHLTGQMSNIPEILKIAAKYNLPVVEDACQCMMGEIDGKKSGTSGNAGAFSLHPLKAMNVWGDGGVVVTNDDSLNVKLRRLRNHGLKNRDEIVMLGHNSRLDTLQAVVGNHFIDSLEWVTKKRIEFADMLDEGLGTIPQITLPTRYKNRRLVYHLYIVFAENRDDLYKYCSKNGIEVKVHYPIPLYLQEGLAHLGYKEGDFPVTDRHARTMISFPLHQYLDVKHAKHIVEVVKSYYGN